MQLDNSTPYSVYANASQRGYCAKLNLCNDIERNPGPSIHNIDPSLTIKVPFSQSDIMTFLIFNCIPCCHNVKGMHARY